MLRLNWLLLAAVLVGAVHIVRVHGQSPQRGGEPTRVPTALDLLELEDVRAELRVEGEQLEKVRTIKDEAQSKLQGMIQAVDDLPGEQRREQLPQLREKIQQLRQQVDQQVASQLSAQQRQRLQQLQLQALLRRIGLFQVLTQEAIATQLSVGEGQQTKLREAQQTFQRELAQQIRQLQAKAQQQMLDVLTPEQRNKWQAMIGEPFEFAVRQQEPAGSDR